MPVVGGDGVPEHRIRPTAQLGQPEGDLLGIGERDRGVAETTWAWSPPASNTWIELPRGSTPSANVQVRVFGATATTALAPRLQLPRVAWAAAIPGATMPITASRATPNMRTLGANTVLLLFRYMQPPAGAATHPSGGTLSPAGSVAECDHQLGTEEIGVPQVPSPPQYPQPQSPFTYRSRGPGTHAWVCGWRYHSTAVLHGAPAGRHSRR